MKPILLAMLLTFLGAAVHAGELYRWVDGQGRVHYSQTPPKSGSYETLRQAPPPDSAPNLEALRQRQSEQESGRREQRAQAAAAAEAAQQREQDCLAARERLRYLDERGARRLAAPGPDGQMARYTEERFAAERRKATDAISANCN